jgi:predicted phosphodiesterase
MRLAAVSDTHSHVPFIGADRAITMFNPGSVGPRRLMLPIVCIQQVSAAIGDSVAQRLCPQAIN